MLVKTCFSSEKIRNKNDINLCRNLIYIVLKKKPRRNNAVERRLSKLETSQRNPSILDSAAKQRASKRHGITESFRMMSRKHLILLSQNGEREVMPEA